MTCAKWKWHHEQRQPIEGKRHAEMLSLTLHHGSVTIVLVPGQEARAAMKQLSQEMRLHEKGHSAIADLLFLYASTIYWFSALRSYKVSACRPLSYPVHIIATLL